MRNNLIFSVLYLVVLSSCTQVDEDRRIVIEKGRAEILINNYFEAYQKKDFENHVSLQTTVNFKNDISIERVTDLEHSFYVLKDSFAYIENNSFVESETQFFPLSEKPIGLSYIDINLNEETIKRDEDTLINDIPHKHITLEKGEELKTIILKKTDTIYSFSLSKEIEQLYKGVVTNIQIYNKQHDLFTSIYVDYSKPIEIKEEDIIDFNVFLKNK